MNLGGMLDTVLSFALIMLLLSLLVESVLELIKRFFATKAKTMEALLVAMGENAIRDALVTMKVPPKSKGTPGLSNSDTKQTKQAIDKLKEVDAVAIQASEKARQARAAAVAAKQSGATNAAQQEAAAIKAENEAVNLGELEGDSRAVGTVHSPGMDAAPGVGFIHLIALYLPYFDARGEVNATRRDG
jgi:hypothetical protein